MDPATLEALREYFDVAGPTLVFMLVTSVLAVALALERFVVVRRARRAIARVDERVVEAARKGDLDEARRLCEQVPSPWRDVYAQGLDRALGRVRGDPATAMARELKRAVGTLRSGVWLLGTGGALMPFAGLLGTVVGVMASFKAIGQGGQGGFAVVSAGISEALIATAGGLAVAIEAVFLFNVLQNIIAATGRDAGLLVDELGELIHARKADARPAGG